MIRVEITSMEVAERPVTFTRGGKERTFNAREQIGYAYTVQPNGQVQPHPDKIVISLDEKQPAFAAGMYLLAPESLYVNRFGKLDIGRVRLTPVARAGVKAA